mgnify:CR=1 FL=1
MPLDMLLRSQLTHIRRGMARSMLLSRVAAYASRQLQGGVCERLGGDPDSDRNGEQRLIEVLGPHISTFVDVGANVGDWSARVVGAASQLERGHLLEPNRAACARLEERFADLTSLRIHPVAAARTPGTIEFFEEPGCGETSSTVAGSSRADAVRREVPCTTVDAFLGDEGIEELDWLKIDAEGADLAVLQGAIGSLSAHRVRWVQFEYNGAWIRAGARLSDALELLDDHGYRTLLIHPRGLLDFPYDIYRDFYGYSNFLAASPSSRDALAPLLAGAA